MWGIRHGWMLLAVGTCMSAAAAAQEMDAPAGRPVNLPPGAVVQPLDTGPSAELRRNLVTLAENPRSVSALVGAGRAALEMGDPDAALTFFSRADEAEPRNPRAKAGMAAALVQLEQPQAGLTLFQEAMQLGAPEAEIAGDLGLAYDTLGDPAQAQRYYNIALRNRDDPDIRRRLALSLAISGQREQAMRTIDGQLRRNDRAAWRTQAFILALTGDTAGANRAAQSVMPAGAAAAIAPFLARMAALSPSQKALAVHFGHFPSDGSRPTAYAANTAPTYTPPPPPPVARARPDAPAATVPDRRQWPTTPLQSAAVTGSGQPRSTLVEALRPRTTPPQTSAPQSSTPTPAAAPARPLQRFQPNTPDTQTAIAASTTTPTPGFSLAPGGPQPGAPAPPSPTPVSPVVEVQARPFSEIASVVNALPAEEQPSPGPTVVRPPNGGPPAMTDRQIRDALAREREQANRPAQPPTRTATAATRTPSPPPRPTPAAPPRPTRPANPSRHWVQIAGGANRATLPREFARLRALAPNLLGNRPAWTTPLNATNRLLVGPFDTPRAAQAFVNQLGQSDISAFAWTSPAGQEIERLQTPR